MSQSALPTLELLPHPSPVADDVRAGLIADPGFGKVFTDHMVTIKYSEGQGWHSATLGPRGPLTLDPAQLQSLTALSGVAVDAQARCGKTVFEEAVLITCRQALALVQMPQAKPLRLPAEWAEKYAELFLKKA